MGGDLLLPGASITLSLVRGAIKPVPLMIIDFEPNRWPPDRSISLRFALSPPASCVNAGWNWQRQPAGQHLGERQAWPLAVVERAGLNDLNRAPSSSEERNSRHLAGRAGP